MPTPEEIKKLLTEAGIEPEDAVDEEAEKKEKERLRLYTKHLASYQSMLEDLAKAGAIQYGQAAEWYNTLARYAVTAFNEQKEYKDFLNATTQMSGLPFANLTSALDASAIDSDANRSFFVKDIVKQVGEQTKAFETEQAAWTKWEKDQADFAAKAQAQYEADYADWGQTQKTINEIVKQNVERQRIPGWQGRGEETQFRPEQLAGQPAPPGVGGIYGEALAGLSENERAYFERNTEEVAAGAPWDAREAWWNALHPEEQAQGMLPEDYIAWTKEDLSRAELARTRGRQLGVTLGDMGSVNDPNTPEPMTTLRRPESAYEAIIASQAAGVERLTEKLAADTAAQRAAVSGSLMGAGGQAYVPEAKAPSTVDPMEEYLKKYPFSAEYMKQSPTQRGFRSYRFTPPARYGG